jgi:hypothetical protein
LVRNLPYNILFYSPRPGHKTPFNSIRGPEVFDISKKPMMGGTVLGIIIASNPISIGFFTASLLLF